MNRTLIRRLPLPLRAAVEIVLPTGEHRARRAAAVVPLAQLLGQAYPLAPVQGVLVQAWDDCPPCGKATAGVLHKDGWTCGECLTVTPPSEGDQ